MSSENVKIFSSFSNRMRIMKILIFKVVDVLGLDQRFLRIFAHHLDDDVGDWGEGSV